MTVERAREIIEMEFPVGKETWYRKAVTGEKYETFSFDSVKREGAEASGYPKFASSPAEAVDIFLSSFIELANSRKCEGAKLYWRVPPTLKDEYLDELTGCYVRCRFLISNKLPIPEREKFAPHPPAEPNTCPKCGYELKR